MRQLSKTISNLLVFLILTFAIFLLWWLLLTQDYLFASSPVGSDYFNALTYQVFFSKHLPLPPSGWLPFWNQGAPVVGGYPWLTFYQIRPLTNFFDVATSIEVFAATSLLIFFLASFLLFWQVSQSRILAFAATLIVLATRATYYPLTTGAFIIQATSLWYLPVTFIFIYKFFTNFKATNLVIAGVFGGFSLLHSAPTNLLIIILPSVALLATMLEAGKKFKDRVGQILLFLLVSATIGSLGLYSLFLQIFAGAGTGGCNSPQCWGIYPKHLIVWMNSIPAILILGLLLIVFATKFFKKEVRFAYFFPPLAALIVLILYAAAAKLKLINGLANVVFPTRTFWAANLFLLLAAAAAFFSLKKVLPKFSQFLALVILLMVSFWFFSNPPKIHKDATNTVPADAASYTIPKYQTKQLTEIVPDWILSGSANFRLDTASSGLNHWWNTVSDIPTVRGYSNHPLGVHRDWLYFLQIATRDVSPQINQELVKDQALFLLDAFGVGFIENSIASYPPQILNDPEIITNSTKGRESFWYQLSPKIVTPIVSPTRTQPVLFVGDEAGYNNFIRTIAMTNLNSRILVPVKGPKNLGSVTKEDFENFPVLVLYRFAASKSDFEKLGTFVKKGGKVLIESGSALSHPKGTLPEVFPINSIDQVNTHDQNPNFQSNNSKFLKDVSLQNFSPLIFQNRPWELSLPTNGSIKNGGPVIYYKNNPVVVESKFGQGAVIWSGLNLPFHIVDYNNFEEAKFFKNLLTFLLTAVKNEPSFQIQRPVPERIEVVGKELSGIYFKENYHSGWKAQLHQGSAGQAKLDGKKLKVYRAGFDFMYIPISPGQTENLKVLITFSGNVVTWSLFWLSLFSLLFSILYLLFPKLFKLISKKVVQIFTTKIKTRASKWAANEE